MKIKDCRITNKYVFFWGSIFSNWYGCHFTYQGHDFYNTEQAFMWEKARHFNDFETADLILKTPNPRENKKLGRSVRNFNAESWMINSYTCMVAVNLCKFSQNEALKDILLSTSKRVLVEASPYDKIWGIGLDMNDDNCLDEHKWQGMNLLGKVLTYIRNEYKKEL